MTIFVSQLVMVNHAAFCYSDDNGIDDPNKKHNFRNTNYYDEVFENNMPENSYKLYNFVIQCIYHAEYTEDDVRNISYVQFMETAEMLASHNMYGCSKYYGIMLKNPVYWFNLMHTICI
jgi:hypothetical protein